MSDSITLFLVLSGLVFYIAGTVGLIRLPDTLCRLHAVTKADNLGLGLLAIGISLQLSEFLLVMKVMLIWFLILAASAASGQLIAKHVDDQRGPQHDL